MASSRECDTDAQLSSTANDAGILSLTRRALVGLRTDTPTLLSTALMLLSGVVGGVVLSRALAPSGRGVWAGVTGWTALIAWAATLGIDEALPTVASNNARRGIEVMTRFVRLTVGPAAAVASAFVWLSFGEISGAAAVLSALYVPGYVLLRRGLAGLLAAHELRLWLRCRALLPTAQTLTLGALALIGRLTPNTAVGSLGPVSISCGLIASALFARATRGYPPSEHQLNSKDLLRFGLHMQLVGLPAAINWRVDQLVMVFLVSRSELGIYAVAVSVAVVPNAFLSAVAEQALPTLARSPRDDLRQISRHLLRRLVVVYLTTAIPMVLLGPWLIPRVFGSEFSDAVGESMVLVGAVAGVLLSTWAATILRTLHRPDLLARVEGVGAALTLIAIVPAVAALGAWGAVAVSLVAYWSKAALSVVLARKRLDEVD